MTDADLDPFFLLGQDDSTLGEVDGADLFEAASRRFDPSQPEPLAALLESDDLFIRRRGLIVFGNLGRKALGLLDQALRSVDHPDYMARSALMDGVLCYPASLSSAQARTVLELANDPKDLVRSKIVAFLRESEIEVLREAIQGMPPAVAHEHLRGLERLATPDRSPQALLEEGASTSGIGSTFALAAVERMAKNGLIENAPSVEGSWIAEATQAQIARLMRRSERIQGGAVRSV